MNDTLEQIPPEAWPYISLAFNITCFVTAIWLAITVFVLWRRNASNLTPVNAAARKRSAQPDFLKVDHAGREAAIARGEAFDEELDRREAEAARAGRRPTTMAQRVAGLISLLMSLFTLATMIYSAIFQVSRMGAMFEQYSTAERLIHVIQQHPIAFVVTSCVVIFHVYRYVTHRKWQEG